MNRRSTISDDYVAPALRRILALDEQGARGASQGHGYGPTSYLGLLALSRALDIEPDLLFEALGPVSGAGDQKPEVKVSNLLENAVAGSGLGQTLAGGFGRPSGLSEPQPAQWQRGVIGVSQRPRARFNLTTFNQMRDTIQNAANAAGMGGAVSRSMPIPDPATDEMIPPTKISYQLNYPELIQTSPEMRHFLKTYQAQQAMLARQAGEVASPVSTPTTGLKSPASRIAPSPIKALPTPQLQLKNKQGAATPAAMTKKLKSIWQSLSKKTAPAPKPKSKDISDLFLALGIGGAGAAMGYGAGKKSKTASDVSVDDQAPVDIRKSAMQWINMWLDR